MVLMSPETLKVIGVHFVFDSAFGLKPPLAVSSRFPARTLTGFSAVAIPVSAIATSNAVAPDTTAALGTLPRILLISLSPSSPLLPGPP